MSPRSAAARLTLVLACGNPSRGDDALGPTLIEHLACEPGIDADLLCDFQLQIEHVLDIQGRKHVVFVDAAATGVEPFAFARVLPEQSVPFTTHALSPGALLRVYDQVAGTAAPECWLLAIRGYRFGLGDTLSEGAGSNLSEAQAFLVGWLCSDGNGVGV